MQDNAIVIIAGIFLIIAVPCYLLYLLGMYIQKRIIKKNPEHSYVKKQTGTELAWMGIVVLCMLVGVSIYELAPNSLEGTFLESLFNGWYGWLAIPAILYVIGWLISLAGFLLRKFGSEN